MAWQKHATRRAFSLVELVVVVVIIGIIAAIAAPRFSAATSTAVSTSIAANIATVTRAMAHFKAEHGDYPGFTPGTGVPDGALFVKQLLEYSDENGNVDTSYGYPYVYGPYLRSPFPKNPLNDLDTVKAKLLLADAVAPNSTGWVAVLSTGEFGINVTADELEDIGVNGAEADGFIR